MLKIVVFDGGWGGELVADYLAGELKTVEVKRVIDWEHAPYDAKTISEIKRLASECLRSYIGKADLIVLGGYAVSLALSYLVRKFPEQKFVGMGINYYRILKTRNYPSQIAIFVDSILIKSTVCQEIRQNLPYSTIIAPDCSGWEELINIGEMSREMLRLDLRDYFRIRPPMPEIEPNSGSLPAKSKGLKHHKPIPEHIRRPLIENICKQRGQSIPAPFASVISDADAEAAASGATGVAKLSFRKRTRHRPIPGPSESPNPPARPRNRHAYPPEERIAPDVILLLNTNFWEIRSDIEALFGYRVRVLDFRQKLLHDTCTALELKGIDGCRSK